MNNRSPFEQRRFDSARGFRPERAGMSAFKLLNGIVIMGAVAIALLLPAKTRSREQSDIDIQVVRGFSSKKKFPHRQGFDGLFADGGIKPLISGELSNIMKWTERTE